MDTLEDPSFAGSVDKWERNDLPVIPQHLVELAVDGQPEPGPDARRDEIRQDIEVSRALAAELQKPEVPRVSVPRHVIEELRDQLRVTLTALDTLLEET